MSARRRRGEDEFADERSWLAEEDIDASPWPPDDEDGWQDGPEQASGGGRHGRHSAADQGAGWEPTVSLPEQAGPGGRPSPGTPPGWDGPAREEPGRGDPDEEDRYALRREPDPPSRRAAPWEQDPPVGDGYPGNPARNGLTGDRYAGPPGQEAAGQGPRRGGRPVTPPARDPFPPGGYRDPGDRYAAPDDPSTNPLQRPSGRAGDPGSRYGGPAGAGRPRTDPPSGYHGPGGGYRDRGGQYRDPGGGYGDPGDGYRDPGGQYGEPGGWDREPAGRNDVRGGRDAGLGGRYRDPDAPYGDPDGWNGDPGAPYGDSAGRAGDRDRGYRVRPEPAPGRHPDSRGQYTGAGDGYPPPDRGETGRFPGAGARRGRPGGDDYGGEDLDEYGGRDATRGRAPGRDDPGWDDQDGYQDEGWPFGGDAGDGDSGGRPGRKRRGRWAGPSSLLIVAAIILIPLIVGGIYAYRVISSHYDPPNYSGAGTGTVIFQVKPGDNSETVGNRLAADGVVASSRALVLAAEHSSNASALQPGSYRLHKHMNAQLAWNLLVSPSARVQLKVTIPEGWRVTEILAELGKHSGISASDYNKAIKDTSALGLPSYARGNPEGYLYPATYEIQPGMTATSVLKAMVTAFNQEAASVNLPKAAAHGNLTPAEAIVVASLAQAEGGKDSDFPKITRVIYNRLAAHMPLGLDSTVLYALHKYGILASSQDLKVKSPYNTYTHQGLPPAPIDSPGNAAIQAALHPATGNWLYFVTVNPKTKNTVFTSSPTVFQQLKNELQQYLSSHGG